jgi:mannose-6-phosphate isomerase-like protein (cupin superfamily)
VRFLTLALAATAVACPYSLAGSPQTAVARLWTAADIASLNQSLARTRAPYTQVLTGKTYGALMLRRAVSGGPELHVKLNDFFVVLSGKGEVRVGGSVSGERTVAPGEKRGRKLTGGTVYRIGRGDILFVPANHWLQVLIPRGQVLQAVIIKTR